MSPCLEKECARRSGKRLGGNIGPLGKGSFRGIARRWVMPRFSRSWELLTRDDRQCSLAHLLVHSSFLFWTSSWCILFFKQLIVQYFLQRAQSGLFCSPGDSLFRLTWNFFYIFLFQFATYTIIFKFIKNIHPPLWATADRAYRRRQRRIRDLN
jgi:hypothetical protein